MAVILINPNSTQAMTDSALAAARRTSPDITFEGWTSTDGPPAIQGPADGDAAIPPLLKLVRKASDAAADLIIIACFDDTGLAEARQIATCPVIGIGQASFVMAALLAGPTAIITTVPEAVPVITQNVADQGHAGTITKIQAASVPVLMLEEDTARAARAFGASAATLPADTANLILGCAGAVTITEAIQAQVPFRVIDGVTAAARLSRAFV